MNNIDIVLIKANNQKKLYQDLSASLSGIEPPLWLVLSAAYLRAKGFRVAALDAEAENLDAGETVRQVSALKPVLAAVVVSGTNPSASTTNMPGAGELLREFKRQAPEIVTTISGLHPSALPERTAREEAADFVIQGEGFFTFEELLTALKSGKKREDAFAIPGLWYRRGEEVISNPRAPNVADLSVLPMPAWDLLAMKKYRSHNWHAFDDIESRKPYAVIYTSLGCPYHCSFCCINSIFGKPGIRYRPMDQVAAEVDHLVKTYGIRQIKIMDELFAINEKRVFEFCDKISALGHDLNFWVYGRIDTIKPEMLPRMRKAGIRWLAYGIEAGSKKVRDGVSKGRFDTEEIRKAVAMTHAAGIEIVSNFIFGLPDDDLATMQETLDLAKELNCAYANFYCAMAYPGSDLYDQAVKQGLPLPKTWSGYAQFSEDSLPLPTKHLTSGQVLKFRDQAFDNYYQDPRYLARIEEKFGTKTVLHIKKMCSVKLRRKFYVQNEDVFFHTTA